LSESVKIIECPRDAWQGLAKIIPTDAKVRYLLGLAAAGFQHIDAVSFVSPRRVRQMADSEEVMKGLLAGLPAGAEPPEIIGIVVNNRGMERALATPGVTTLGYPYSISAYFRRANANMTRAESRLLVEQLRTATKASASSSRNSILASSRAARSSGKLSSWPAISSSNRSTFP